MSSTARVGGFVLGLVAVAAAATGIGAAVGPVGTQPAGHQTGHQIGAGEAGGDPAGPGTEVPETPEVPGGLQVSEAGYSLEVLGDTFARPGRTTLRFRVTDSTGAPVTDYVESHGRDLHLIVVRRDLTDYQHVHPTLDDAGTWSVPLELREAGEYRLLADFRPTGAESGHTLGHDLSVAGAYDPRALPATGRTVQAGRYEVRLDGELVAGRTSRVTLTVSRDGVPVTDLQPYLGAYGHLVALRDHDLAYLHVHPDGEPGDGRTAPGPSIAFDAEVPSTGDFRLFLDFRHEGRVRTAAFTVTTTDAAGPDDPAGDPAEGDHQDHQDPSTH